LKAAKKAGKAEADAARRNATQVNMLAASRRLEDVATTAAEAAEEASAISEAAKKLEADANAAGETASAVLQTILDKTCKGDESEECVAKIEAAKELLEQTVAKQEAAKAHENRREAAAEVAKDKQKEIAEAQKKMKRKADNATAMQVTAQTEAEKKGKLLERAVTAAGKADKKVTMVLQSVEKSIEALPAEVKAGAYYEVLQLLEASAEQDRLSSIAAAMYAAKASADKAVKEVTVQRKADIETRTRADAKAAQDAAKDVQRKAEAAADAVGVAIQAVPMAAAKLKHVNSTCKGVNACIDLNAYANGTLVRSKWDVKALAETSDKIHKEAAEGPVAKTLARALKAKEAAQSDVDEAAVALANVKVLVARANDAVELSKAAYTHADNLVANVVDKLEVAIAKLPVAHAASTYEDLLTRQQGVAMKKRTWAKEVANDIAVFAASAAMKKAIAKGTARDVVQMQKETGIAQNALLSAEQTLADAVQAETEAAGMVVRTAAIYKSFKVSCAVVPPGSCIDDFWNHALRSYERIDKVKASAKAAAKAVETKKAATDDREKKTEDAMKANDVYVAAVKKQGAAQAEADQAAEDAAAADSLAAAAQGKHDFTADAAAAAAVMVDSLLSKLENKLSALSHRTAAKEFAKVVNTLAAAAKEDKLTLEEDKKKVADAESDEVLKKRTFSKCHTHC